MQKIFILSLALVTILSACTSKVQQKQQNRKVIIGYIYGGDNPDLSGYNPHDYTHINYAFANVTNGKMTFEMENDYNYIEQLIESKKENPALKILVSVGGWTWSGNFSDMSLTTESRKTFISSCIEQIRKTGIDGIDIDWEYPGLPGMDNIHRAEDKENFTLLLKEMREALTIEAQEQKRNEPYLLTIAAGAIKEFLDHTEMAEASKYLDYVNLMTYDYYTTADSISGHHANLNNHPLDSKGISCHTSINLFLEAGVPKEKLVMGLPFYDRFFGVINDKSTQGMYKPYLPDTTLSYNVVKQNIIEGKFPLYFDTIAQATYRWNEEQGWFMSVEDTNVVKIKARYIKDHELAGAMFWAYDTSKLDLLRILNEELK